MSDTFAEGSAVRLTHVHPSMNERLKRRVGQTARVLWVAEDKVAIRFGEGSDRSGDFIVRPRYLESSDETDPQRTRQRTRAVVSGQYQAYPKCSGCRKPVSPDTYASHPMTDCVGDDGVNWGDTALVLCDDCYCRTDHMRNASEFSRYRDTGWY